MPKFPPLARQARIFGTVAIEVGFENCELDPASPHIVSGHPMLTAKVAQGTTRLRRLWRAPGAFSRRAFAAQVQQPKVYRQRANAVVSEIGGGKGRSSCRRFFGCPGHTKQAGPPAFSFSRQMLNAGENTEMDASRRSFDRRRRLGTSVIAPGKTALSTGRAYRIPTDDENRRRARWLQTRHFGIHQYRKPKYSKSPGF